MILLIKVKDTENIIGLKEDIAMRLEGVADIEMIDVITDHTEQEKIIQKLTGERKWTTSRRE